MITGSMVEEKTLDFPKVAMVERVMVAVDITQQEEARQFRKVT